MSNEKLNDEDEVISPDTVQNDDNNQGKTLLEILELEMRARAIRALLKRDDKLSVTPPSASQETKIINDETDLVKSNEIIDLTTSEKTELIELPTKGITSKQIKKEIVEGDSVHHKRDNDGDSEICDNGSSLKEKSMETEIINDQQVKLSNSEEMVAEQLKNRESCIFGGDSADLLSGDVDKNGQINTKNIIDEADNDSCEMSNSWAQRWLEKKSKDVKRLVTTSKMCTTIRNKMKRSNINKKLNNETSEPDLPKMPSEFKGSIDEYNMLIKVTKNKQQESLEVNQKAPDIVQDIISHNSGDSLPTTESSNIDIEANKKKNTITEHNLISEDI